MPGSSKEPEVPGDLAERLYADREVSVECVQLQVVANADAMKQLQWILLDNAARFAGPGIAPADRRRGALRKVRTRVPYAGFCYARFR